MWSIKAMYILLTSLAATVHLKILRGSCSHFADYNIVLQDLSDSGQSLKSLSGKNQRQCLLECMSLLYCRSINHKKDGGLCDLLDRNLTSSAGLLRPNMGWKFISTSEYTLNVGNTCTKLSPCQNKGKCVDTCEAPGFKCTCDDGYTGAYCEEEREYSSCHAAYTAGLRKDGIIKISNAGYHYCVLSDTLQCENGGYTLVMRTDGSLSTFRYGSSHWTTSTVYNDVFALREGLHGQESKFQGFNTMPFVKVCIGMKVGTTMNFLTLTHSSTSLLNYMKDGTYHASSQRRTKWLNLVPGGGLQNNCNKEGFNSVVNARVASYVRIGILSNEQTDCNSPDTAIGIGIGGSHLSSKGITTGSVRNKVAAKGYIFIK